MATKEYKIDNNTVQVKTQPGFKNKILVLTPEGDEFSVDVFRLITEMFFDSTITINILKTKAILTYKDQGLEIKISAQKSSVSGGDVKELVAKTKELKVKDTKPKTKYLPITVNKEKYWYDDDDRDAIFRKIEGTYVPLTATDPNFKLVHERVQQK
jgi:hypothetical protein